MRTDWWSLATSATAVATAGEPGVWYSARPISPRKTSASGIMQVGGRCAATAQAVACGGCAWQHDLAFGLAFMMAIWVLTSLVRL